MNKERMKYLFKAVLGVDVDQVVRNVVATIAVERARQVRKHSEEWQAYMEKEGGLILLPHNIVSVGRRGEGR